MKLGTGSKEIIVTAPLTELLSRRTEGPGEQSEGGGDKKAGIGAG